MIKKVILLSSVCIVLLVFLQRGAIDEVRSSTSTSLFVQELREKEPQVLLQLKKGSSLLARSIRQEASIGQEAEEHLWKEVGVYYFEGKKGRVEQFFLYRKAFTGYVSYSLTWEKGKKEAVSKKEREGY